MSPRGTKRRRAREPRMAPRLVRLLAHESPRALKLGVITAAAQSILLVPTALLVRHVFNEITARNTSGVVVGGVLILGLYLASALFGYLSRIVIVRATTAAAERLRGRLLAKVYAMSQGWHDGRRAGDVHSLIVSDAERVETVLSDLAYPLIPATVVGLTLTVAAAIVNPELFLVMVAVLVPFMLAGQWLLRRTRVQAVAWRTAANAFSASTQLLLRAMRLAKIEGAESWELSRREGLTHELSMRYRALETARASHSAVYNTVAAFAGSVLLIVGGASVASGDMPLGDMLAFYAILALLLRQLQLVGPGVATATVGLESLRRVEAFLDAHDDGPHEGGRALDFRGGIALEDVTFGYTDVPVLRGVHLTIRPSECVALVGPNGAGKSTLISIVLGLYRPGSGRVLADGVPYEEADMQALRRRMGVVLQDPIVFPGTIRENIAYGRDATQAEIEAAAAAAIAAPFVDTLPQGYDTLVGDEGVGLSGGQRQRIAIARALLGDPVLLLLDEPTTYLDEGRVVELMASLTSLPQAPTILLVTHDPEVARHADRTVHLREGRIPLDEGSPERSAAGDAGRGAESRATRSTSALVSPSEKRP